MVGCDGLSELPDSLLTHILSYLPPKDAVKTSVLSKSWRFRWLEVASELDLNAVDFLLHEDDSSLVDLMNKSLLRKFKITYDSSLRKRGRRVMEWIAEAVHRGVKHLDVENKTFRQRVIINFMPKYLYVSKTLVSLSLVNVGLEDPKFEVSLPCLKSIHLDNVHYRGGDVCLVIMERLISGSPVLENLTTDVPDFKEPQQPVYREVPWSLEYVKINKLTMKKRESGIGIVDHLLMSNQEAERYKKNWESGIELVNYFLENSGALRKMTLSSRDSDMTNEEAESYKKLLTSTKLSPTCQILFLLEKSFIGPT